MHRPNARPPVAQKTAVLAPFKTVAEKLSPLHMTPDEFKVLETVCFYPAMTINMLRTRLPEVASVPSTVRSLTARSLLHRYQAVYILTFLGWKFYAAAETLLASTLGP